MCPKRQTKRSEVSRARQRDRKSKYREKNFLSHSLLSRERIDREFIYLESWAQSSCVVLFASLIPMVSSRSSWFIVLLQVQRPETEILSGQGKSSGIIYHALLKSKRRETRQRPKTGVNDKKNSKEGTETGIIREEASPDFRCLKHTPLVYFAFLCNCIKIAYNCKFRGQLKILSVRPER